MLARGHNYGQSGAVDESAIGFIDVDQMQFGIELLRELSCVRERVIRRLGKVDGTRILCNRSVADRDRLRIKRGEALPFPDLLIVAAFIYRI